MDIMITELLKQFNYFCRRCREEESAIEKLKAKAMTCHERELESIVDKITEHQQISNACFTEMVRAGELITKLEEEAEEQEELDRLFEDPREIDEQYDEETLKEIMDFEFKEDKR